MARLTTVGDRNSNVTLNQSDMSVARPGRKTFVTNVSASIKDISRIASRGDLDHLLSDGGFPFMMPVLLGISDNGFTALTDLYKLPHLVLTGGRPVYRTQALANCIQLSAYALKSRCDRIVVMAPVGSRLAALEKTTSENKLNVEYLFGRKSVISTLNDMADLCKSRQEHCASTRILEPVGRFYWGLPNPSHDSIESIYSRYDDDERPPSIITRESGEMSRIMVVIDSVSGLLWLEGGPVRSTLEYLLTHGPSSGIHLLVSSSLLQVPPLGHFVDKDLGGHWFYSSSARKTPMGLFIGTGLINAERFRHVTLADLSDPVPAHFGNTRRKSDPVNDPDPDLVYDLLSRESFFSPRITGLHSDEKACETQLIEELSRRGLFAQNTEKKWMPCVDADHYYRSVSPWCK